MKKLNDAIKNVVCECRKKFTEMEPNNAIYECMPALRMLLSDDSSAILNFNNNSIIEEFAKNSLNVDEISALFSPEDLAIAKTKILYSEFTGDVDGFLTEIQEKILEFKNINSYTPKVILIKGLGLITAGLDFKNAKLKIDLISALIDTCTSDSYNKLGKELVETYLDFIKGQSALTQVKKGRIENKVAIVTGGAQGFGGGIVKEMIQEGANVIIADLNEELGAKYAAELNENLMNNQVTFVKTDVSNEDSVLNLINQSILTFGGLDVFVSNAGVLRAGGLDEMELNTFEFMTKVNYSAYFLCAKFASKVLKIQNKYNANYYSDIIQINSKSGLKGSNRNFAYAGGKFGGIGLTQSFALELMPNKIKVNSICPGNFFDGPLWSDPEKGLFVQYLNAKKVPNAKTVEDVKRFYEAQVPANRGCNVVDVMRAIYYVIEQEYETGQAIPVTGGQNMLN